MDACVCIFAHVTDKRNEMKRKLKFPNCHGNSNIQSHIGCDSNKPFIDILAFRMDGGEGAGAGAESGRWGL